MPNASRVCPSLPAPATASGSRPFSADVASSGPFTKTAPLSVRTPSTRPGRSPVETASVALRRTLLNRSAASSDLPTRSASAVTKAPGELPSRSARPWSSERRPARRTDTASAPRWAYTTAWSTALSLRDDAVRERSASQSASAGSANRSSLMRDIPFLWGQSGQPFIGRPCAAQQGKQEGVGWVSFPRWGDLRVRDRSGRVGAPGTSSRRAPPDRPPWRSRGGSRRTAR